MTISALIFGATGLTGRNLVSTTAALESFSPLYTISRRAPYTSPEGVTSFGQGEPSTGGVKPAGKMTTIVEDNDAGGNGGRWAAKLTEIATGSEKGLDVVMSALGTTRTTAGGIKAQWKVDHDLNIELARAAHAAGVKTYVFISSAGTRGLFSSSVPYSQMKVGVEDAIKDLGFEQAIILRPGAILGDRDRPHNGGPWLNTLVNSLAYISEGARDAIGQDADVIARAGVAAAMKAAKGEVPEGKKGWWVLEMKDIVKLGRDEWRE